MIDIYTDGGNKPSKKLGAYSFVILKDGIKLTDRAEVEELTTNNKMELKGAIEAIKYCIENTDTYEQDYTLYSDSKYVVNGISEWINKWIKNDWLTTKGPVLNIELWQELYKLSKELRIKFVWVRGHDGNHYNELVDRLCNNAIKNYIR